jgi:hypothetical protein
MLHRTGNRKLHNSKKLTPLSKGKNGLGSTDDNTLNPSVKREVIERQRQSIEVQWGVFF